MRTLVLVAIYDLVSQTIWGNQVFAYENEADAKRWFGDVCRNEKSGPYLHPQDFVLVSLGVVGVATLEVVSVPGNRNPAVVNGGHASILAFPWQVNAALTPESMRPAEQAVDRFQELVNSGAVPERM